MKEHFVIDPLISKRQQLMLATQLCRMVLKVRHLFSLIYSLPHFLIPTFPRSGNPHSPYSLLSHYPISITPVPYLPRKGGMPPTLLGAGSGEARSTRDARHTLHGGMQTRRVLRGNHEPHAWGRGVAGQVSTHAPCLILHFSLSAQIRRL